MTESEKTARLFGERLKALRKKMELKQTVLAELIGTSQDTISDIEIGQISPRLDMLYKIAEQFGMTLSQLVDFQDAPKAKPTVNQPLATHILYLKTKTPQEVKASIKMTKFFLDQARTIYEKPRRRPYGTSSGRKP